MQNLIYLDNAATTFPKPEEVYRFMDEFYRDNGVSPGRSGFDASLEAEELVAETRRIMMEFLNGDGDPDRLTFSYNASDSLNMIIQGLAKKGDHVVTTMLEHNSVLRPLHHLELEGTIEVTHVPFDKHGYIDPDDIKKALRSNTKMVVVNHCSNIIGTVQPVGEIGKICKDAGVLFVVDGAQGAGAVKVDMQAMGIDVYVFTGHKSLMGPTGIGGSYVMKDVTVKYTRFGGTGVRSAQLTHLEEFPYRLECGTLNMTGVAGLNAGVKWINKTGIEKVHNHELALWDRLRTGLQKTDRVITYCAENTENQNAVLSFNIKGIPAADVGMMLDVDHNIACRTGLQCAPKVHEIIKTIDIKGTVRFGIGPFNTEEHIDAAINGVSEIASNNALKTQAP